MNRSYGTTQVSPEALAAMFQSDPQLEPSQVAETLVKMVQDDPRLQEAIKQAYLVVWQGEQGTKLPAESEPNHKTLEAYKQYLMGTEEWKASDGFAKLKRRLTRRRRGGI